MKFDLQSTLDGHLMMRFATTVTINSISLTIPFFDESTAYKLLGFLTSGKVCFFPKSLVKNDTRLCLMKPDRFLFPITNCQL